MDIKYIELSKDNILSFDSYLPKEIVRRILEPEVYGWGVLAEDLTSGVILCERNENMGALHILWLYVDEEVRGNGIGDGLYEKAIEGAGEDMAMVWTEYYYPFHETAEGYFRKKGFEIVVKDEEETDENEVHMASCMLKGGVEGNADERLLLGGDGLNAYRIPRLLALGSYFANLEKVDADLIMPEGMEPLIIFNRGKNTPEVGITVTPDGVDKESYVIMARIELEVEPEEFEKTTAALNDWAEEFVLVSGQLHPENEVVDFIATLPVDAGVPEQEIFVDFITEYLEETDRFFAMINAEAA